MVAQILILSAPIQFQPTLTYYNIISSSVRNDFHLHALPSVRIDSIIYKVNIKVPGKIFNLLQTLENIFNVTIDIQR